MKNSHDWACQAAPATLLHTTNLHNAPSTCMGNFMMAPREECQDDISAATSLDRPPSTSVKRRQIAEDQENIPLINNTAYPHVRKASYRCYIVLIVLAILQNLILIYLPPKKDLSTAMKTKHTKQCCLPSLYPINHAKMLGTMGIQVHDFAYELTSFCVQSLFSHPCQVQPAVK